MNFRESETVELKAVVVDDIKKEIVAFANCNGGKIYIGVGDNGDVLGIADADGAALQVSNMVRDSIKPDITMFLHYQTLDVNGKQVVEIQIQRGTNRPYYIAKKGLRPEGVYIRQGYSSVPATDTAIRSMIKETDGDHFEDMRSVNQELTFLTAAAEFEKRHLAFGSAQMKTLGILNQDGIFTNLGQLLSDQCVHTIRAAVFEGTTQNVFKDRKEFSGSLLKQMDEVYDFIDFRNQTYSTFEKLLRMDTRDYPEIAVREALLNSLVHREYAMRASTLISIFSDRIEFTSIGGLVVGVTLNDVLMGISVCRNVKLANIFYRLELIEAYGTGMKKIMDAYAGTGVTPKIETSDNVFKIILPNVNAQRDAKTAESAPPVDEKAAMVLRILAEKGSIKRKDVQETLEIGQATSVRLLKQMVEQGLLVSKGNGKNTYYCKP